MTSPTPDAAGTTLADGPQRVLPSAAQPPTSAAAAPMLPVRFTPRPGRTGALGFRLGVIGIAIGAALLLVMIGSFVRSFGPGAVLLCTVVAVVPLVGVLFAVRWIDRWEPEPRWVLGFALFWGAGVAVGISLLVNRGLQQLLVSGGNPGQAEALSLAIQAPIVEEIAKGLGVLLLVWIAKRSLDGPVDGLVYAAVSAAGFAFTENILYFGEALIEGGADQLGSTFLLRGLFSPFAHVMFTACTGIALGFGATRTRGAGILGYFALGLAAAIALHALWNGALLVVTDFFGYYFLVQVPLFLFAIGIVLWLRRAEQRATVESLQEYAAAGWFADGEVVMLATASGRRAAARWARTLPGDKRVEMRRFIRHATRLAFVRQRLREGRASADTAEAERALLEAVTLDRAVLLAPPTR
ncbi:PrsW family intramembrane metalloprotease [Microterricola pindariensis]|nr:PrsW family intramembrane metalloprotease [Microterricola pindariensis]